MNQEEKDYICLNQWQLSIVCSLLSRKIGLTKMGLHIAALFQDNEHNDIIGWAIYDSNNNIIERYNDLDDLFNDCINTMMTTIMSHLNTAWK